MKISILTPDLSHNCLGRAYILAKILQKHYEVEIIGPMFGNGIWKPLNMNEIHFESIRVTHPTKFIFGINSLLSRITGDIVYACKPRLTSFGIGLIEKFVKRKTLLLDIDDWELGASMESYYTLSVRDKLKSFILGLIHPHSYWNIRLNEKMVQLADEITVSGSFLQKRFGGTIVCHGRDTSTFDPENFNLTKLRKELNIENKKVITFLGTPHPYKGIEDLIEAITMIEDRSIMLMIVGIESKEYDNRVKLLAFNKLTPERVKLAGQQPFKKIPEFLAGSDLIVIPQRKNCATIGQVPAKVFDALAMAKPIIATNVSDLPEILDGCGWIVEPENPEELAEAIRYVFHHPEEAKNMGEKARKKCIEKYSWDVMEKVLVKLFDKY